MNNPIKVLIVDDSAFVRLLLTEILERDSRIEVVATATDPFDAREKIKKYHPDVLTLDVEMPKMDGITFLKNLMRLRPMPVVMVSTLTKAGAEITLDALKVGAFDFVTKPTMDVKSQLSDSADELIEKVLAAAQCNTAALEARPGRVDIAALTNRTDSRFDLITIGASTGGTEAIRQVITSLPLGLPPIVMAQHIPENFSTSYALRLDTESKMAVTEVQNDTQLLPGNAYLAPGNRHLKVELKNGTYWGVLDDGEKVNRHKPSVDVLFESIAQVCGKKTLAILLTGMGKDGARGLKRLHDCGASTVAQDEASSVVWGMPGSAVALGAAGDVLDINEIAHYIVDNQ